MTAAPLPRLENAHFVGVHIAAVTPRRDRRHVALQWMAAAFGYAAVGLAVIYAAHLAAKWLGFGP